jgi:hypothetical protein
VTSPTPDMFVIVARGSGDIRRFAIISAPAAPALAKALSTQGPGRKRQPGRNRHCPSPDNSAELFGCPSNREFEGPRNQPHIRPQFGGHLWPVSEAEAGRRVT